MIKRRNRTKNTTTLEERLALDSKRARDRARTLPPGDERDSLIRRASRNDVAAHMSEWLKLPGLRAPT